MKLKTFETGREVKVGRSDLRTGDKPYKGQGRPFDHTTGARVRCAWDHKSESDIHICGGEKLGVCVYNKLT